MPVIYLLFVDDVIIFGIGSLCECQEYYDSLKFFCRASGMCFSLEKSSFIFNETGEVIKDSITALLPYKMYHMTKASNIWVIV